MSRAARRRGPGVRCAATGRRARRRSSGWDRVEGRARGRGSATIRAIQRYGVVPGRRPESPAPAARRPVLRWPEPCDCFGAAGLTRSRPRSRRLPLVPPAAVRAGGASAAGRRAAIRHAAPASRARRRPRGRRATSAPLTGRDLDQALGRKARGSRSRSRCPPRPLHLDARGPVRADRQRGQRHDEHLPCGALDGDRELHRRADQLRGRGLRA